MKSTKPDAKILVRGANDVGSAVAHCLFRAGYGVVLHEMPQPASTRRRMSFTDVVFDGYTSLHGVDAQLVNDIPRRVDAGCGISWSTTAYPERNRR